MIPLFNLCVLGLLIIYEFKTRGLSKKSLRDSRNQVIITLTFLQIIIFIHYSMAEDVARIFLQTLEEGCRTVCYFLMMNFFMKQASRLLRNKTMWIKIYRVLLPISLGLFLFTLIWMIVSARRYQISDATLCRSKTYLFNQFSTLIFLEAFAVLGFFITLRVK